MGKRRQKTKKKDGASPKVSTVVPRRQGRDTKLPKVRSVKPRIYLSTKEHEITNPKGFWNGLIQRLVQLKARYKILAIIATICVWAWWNTISKIVEPIFTWMAVEVKGVAADTLDYLITPEGIKVEYDLIEAEKLLKSGRGDEAINIIRELVVQHGKHAEFYYDIGRVLDKQGHLDSAITYYDSAYVIDTSLKWNRRHLGEILLQLDRCGEAVPHFVYVTTIEEADAQLYLDLARAYWCAGFSTEAALALFDATQIRPNILGAPELRDSMPRPSNQ